ncbi:Crp/Fnr family transcriptional regulator [Niveibacterium sp. SC-1]|uniref:Crp/Fnr family transcriptional regulator n=1 Tax=Niveibacterium sp. SC-1 TaxID=3135646 RepID=UPI00311F3575
MTIYKALHNPPAMDAMDPRKSLFPPSRPADAQAVAVLLQDSPWMRALDVAERKRVAAALEIRGVRPGTPLTRRGASLPHWIGVADGLVKLNACADGGRATSFAGMPAGNWFGEDALLQDKPCRYDATALREGVIALLPRAVFVELLEGNLAFNRFLLAQFDEKLGQFFAMLEQQRLLPPEGRVARGIAALFPPTADTCNAGRLEISQEEIGYLVGISRQRVNQALKALERRGLIQVGYGKLQVRDLEALRGFC